MITYISQPALRCILDVSDIHLTDIAFITDTESRLPAKERAQAEQIMTQNVWRQWFVSPASAKLLVHWDASKIHGGISPLSGVCVTMSQALAMHPRFISLLWFAGRHDNRRTMGDFVHENAMLRSLIDQLLRQFDFDMRFFPYPIDPSLAQAQLLILLEWLIRNLPQSRTLCCVIDGVVILERDEYWGESLPVLSKLVQLVNDPSVAVHIKLVLMSTPPTSIVRDTFEKENLILNVNTLPRQSIPPSDERVARVLGATVFEGEEDP